MRGDHATRYQRVTAIMASKIETFFGDYANNAIEEIPEDHHSLLEIFQGCLSGFAIELLEMNDGEFFVLSLHAHQIDDWNISDDRFHALLTRATGSTLYRFETLEEAQGALSRFLSATL